MAGGYVWSLVALSVTVTLLGTRGRTGPERWTAVVVLVYAGRTLTVLTAGVVPRWGS